MAIEVQMSHTIQMGERWDTVRPHSFNCFNFLRVCGAFMRMVAIQDNRMRREVHQLSTIFWAKGRSYQRKASSLVLFDPDFLMESSSASGNQVTCNMQVTAHALQTTNAVHPISNYAFWLYTVKRDWYKLTAQEAKRDDYHGLCTFMLSLLNYLTELP